MARRGFISPKVYLQMAYQRNIRLVDAQAAVIEALPLGKLVCEGCQFPTSMDRLELILAGREDEAARLKPSKVELIPPETWIGLSNSLVGEWDWNSGMFVSYGGLRAPQKWHKIKLKEKQCNELLDRLEARAAPLHSATALPSKERRRSASWDEWVAVVATLAYEHSIGPSSTDRDILDIAARRLGILHEPGKQTKRMKSAAMAIVSRWRETPPAEPAHTKLTFSDPTRKP